MEPQPVVTPRQVGVYIRRSREAQGLTRAQLSELSGVSVRSLASIELGDATGLRLDKLLSIYKALGLSLLTQGEDIASRDVTEPDQLASRTDKMRRFNGHQKPLATPRKAQPRTSYTNAFEAFITRNYGSSLNIPSFVGRKA